jgi:hypothetical protein
VRRPACVGDAEVALERFGLELGDQICDFADSAT